MEDHSTAYLTHALLENLRHIHIWLLTSPPFASHLLLPLKSQSYSGFQAKAFPYHIPMFGVKIWGLHEEILLKIFSPVYFSCSVSGQRIAGGPIYRNFLVSSMWDGWEGGGKDLSHNHCSALFLSSWFWGQSWVRNSILTFSYSRLNMLGLHRKDTLCQVIRHLNI